jgi:hypothetical protein
MSDTPLDPSRYFAAVLADPSHKLPLPDRGGRHFLEEGEVIDSAEPFYAHLLADGSLKPKPADPVPSEPVKPADDVGKPSKPEAPAQKAPAPAAKPDPAA